MKNKKAMQHAQDVEKTRRLLKQFLYALHTSEGFGERRLTRVLIEWSETYKAVMNSEVGEMNEMLMIDRALDKVCPSHIITNSIGREPFVTRRGEQIK